ncbi:ABC transporter ATP-binding protein [Paradesulfitobacterium aromaticivorans]
MAEEILRIREVTKSFGGVQALENVNMTVAKGEIKGLIGPNGAGKSTIVNIISGFLKPDKGQVLFGQINLIGKKPHYICELGITRIFQQLHIFGEMTVLDNVLVGRHMHSNHGLFSSILRTKGFRASESSAHSHVLELLELFRLTHLAEVQANTLSFGEQRLVEIVRALATNPTILILDEPAAGLADSDVNRLQQTLRQIQQRGTTIFVIEHNMKFVMSTCDSLSVLNFGTIIAQGPTATVRQDSAVIKAYLGRSGGKQNAENQ